MKTGRHFLRKIRPRRVNVTLYGASGETYKSLCGDETGYGQKRCAAFVFCRRTACR